MGVQISAQMVLLAQSVLLGLAAGLLYDLLRALRLRLPRLTWMLDSLYCLALAVGAFLFLLRCSGG